MVAQRRDNPFELYTYIYDRTSLYMNFYRIYIQLGEVIQGRVSGFSVDTSLGAVYPTAVAPTRNICLPDAPAQGDDVSPSARMPKRGAGSSTV